MTVSALQCFVCCLRDGLDAASKIRLRASEVPPDSDEFRLGLGYPEAYGYLQAAVETVALNPRRWELCRKHAQQRAVLRREVS
jgi:hypothetical protein